MIKKKYEIIYNKYKKIAQRDGMRQRIKIFMTKNTVIGYVFVSRGENHKIFTSIPFEFFIVTNKILP